MLLCFDDPILGNRYGPGASSVPVPLAWGGRILTLHLNYVAGYTGPLLFLFERTHSNYVDNQGLMGWLRLVGALKLQVSFAKEPYKIDHILQKRPKISRSLLIVAIPYALAAPSSGQVYSPFGLICESPK